MAERMEVSWSDLYKFRNASRLQEVSKSSDSLVFGSLLIAGRCKDSFARVKSANHACEVFIILHISDKAIISAEQRNPPVSVSLGSVSGVVASTSDTMWTPSPVVDVRQVVTSHLLLAGLWRSWYTMRDPNSRSFICVGFVIVVIHIGQLDLGLWQHVRILDAIPTLITGRAR